MKDQTNRPLAHHPSEVIRSMIEGENELINQRINWLMTIQGLLFASLGFVWDKPTAVQLIKVLGLLGVSISIIMLVSLIGATRSQSRLWDWWESNKPKDYDGPDVGGLPPDKNYMLRYIGAIWNWIPIMFIAAWSIVWNITISH